MIKFFQFIKFFLSNNRQSPRSVIMEAYMAYGRMDETCIYCLCLEECCLKRIMLCMVPALPDKKKASNNPENFIVSCRETPGYPQDNHG